jgi:glyoxylase-like metal-dependent hydrolase (beta-lactamase superfamily II)
MYTLTTSWDPKTASVAEPRAEYPTIRKICEEVSMSKKFAVAVLLVIAICFALSVPAAHAQDAKAVIAAASKAMGGDSLKSIGFTGSGTEYSFGQAFNPTQAWPVWPDKTYTRTINYEMPGWRTDRVLGENPPTRKGGGLPPGPTQTVVLNPNSPWAQTAEVWLTPHGFLRAAAAASDATAKSGSMGGKKYTVVSFTAPSKAKVIGYIGADNTVARVETWIDNSILGDIPFEASFTDYKDFNGVKFPTHFVQKQAGYATLDLTISDVKPNVPANLQAAQGGGAPPVTGTKKLADGVYLILPAYAALAVDFKDGIVIVEAPQSEARANTVIEEAKKAIPNKPIKYVINTHGHFDHSGGLRAFVAEGATIVTWQGNKAYYEKVLKQPHTLTPDREETAKKKVLVETVADKKVLTDGNHVIEIHRMIGSNHNDGLMAVYLPKEKILVEADGFNPPAQVNAPPVTPPNPNTVNLADNITRLHLDVETIIPVHYPADGRTVTMAEMNRALGK